MRKGARRVADVLPEIRAGLSAGTVQTASLVEWYVVDFAALVGAVLPDLAAPAKDAIKAEDGITKRMAQAGRLIHESYGLTAVDRLATGPSDTARGWAAYVIACEPALSMADRLARVRPLADDPHFGVREWAWLAVRNHIAGDVAGAIEVLRGWTDDGSANIRRFAVECTRPRGVWCAHIPSLKAEPEPGRVLLEPLRADPSRYVQDSVANWLNDASKTRPEWVAEICSRWLKESPTPTTDYIVRRGLRSS